MQTLSKLTQDNVLTLISFSDEHCLLARNAVTPELFDYPYNILVEKCISYIDKYKRPPKDHLADEIERELQGPDADRYRSAIQQIDYLSRQYDPKYIIEKLTEFIRGQRFEKALYDAAALHTQGKDVEAMEAMRGSLDANLTIFDPGIKVTDLHLLKRSLEDEDLLPSGITALDDLKIGPAKGQLLLFLGVRSSGKSWMCIQAAKMAMWHNLKVAHISLEIGQQLILQRYIQNILALTRWEAENIKVPVFERDENYNIINIEQLTIHPRNLDEPDIIEYIQAGLDKIGPRLERNIRIKSFPSGQLTLPMLRAYLDGLERTEGFKPDLLILDMPMNMNIPLKDFRLAMGRLAVSLRGLAVERNFALIAPHQISKEGARAKFITGLHVAEDWSLLGTADCAIVYNQKPAEHQRGLARLYVDRGRSMQSQLTVLIAQSLFTGQFCIDSALLPKNYTESLILNAEEEGINDSDE